MGFFLGGIGRTGGVGKVGSWLVVLRRGGMGFLPELCPCGSRGPICGTDNCVRVFYCRR